MGEKCVSRCGKEEEKEEEEEDEKEKRVFLSPRSKLGLAALHFLHMCIKPVKKPLFNSALQP